MKNALFSQLLGSRKVMHAADELADYSLKLFQEIRKDAPFPGWREAINEFR